MVTYFTYRKVYGLIIGCMLCIVVKSQNDSMTHLLKEVIITDFKKQFLEASKKKQVIDSSILNLYNTTSINDVLAAQSAIHIKSYGNGNSATTSIRGGNANQTAVLWNGLNIQNPMLGQTDLSLLPTFLFETVGVDYGGGSTINGSGAMGGSILLQNKPSFNKGFNTSLQTSVGSFDTKKIASTVLLSYKKIVSNTRLYYTSSANTYNYIDSLDKEKSIKQVEHAQYLNKGILQEVSFAPNQFHTFNLRFWYNQLERNLPSFANSPSKQSQFDKTMKLNADWQFQKNKLTSTVRFGYFNDQLNYHDSIAQIYSNSNAKTLIIENNNHYDWKQHQFNLGVNMTSYQSNFESYGMLRELNKLTLFGSYKLITLKQKLHYHISARSEWTNLTKVPITASTGLHYQLHQRMAIKVNANNSFRQPTLNDMYWQPGGNPQLKPEESIEFDGGLEFNYKKNNYSLLFEGTYFNRHTNNWIIWLPTSTVYWSPQNIQKVYSRGTETKTEFSFHKKNYALKMILNSAYTLATNETSQTGNDNSQGKQLIYTPRYTGQISILASYKSLSVLISQNYTGYRFTSMDNSSWLSPYSINTIKLTYNIPFKTTQLSVFASINNALNQSYVVVAGRPMPLRNMEAGIRLSYKSIKTR